MRDRFRQFTQRRYKAIEVEGLGPVIIQSLTEGERADIQNRTGNGHAGKVAAMLIAATVVDENHHRIYSDSAEDLDEICRIDSQLTQRLQDEIARHVTPPDVDELVKNSETTGGDAMPSSSPET